MKAPTTISLLVLGGLLISAATAHAQGTAASSLRSFAASDVVNVQDHGRFQLAQQSQNGDGAEQQSKPEEPDHVPGCRYRGGEELQLLV